MLDCLIKRLTTNDLFGRLAALRESRNSPTRVRAAKNIVAAIAIVAITQTVLPIPAPSTSKPPANAPKPMATCASSIPDGLREPET